MCPSFSLCACRILKMRSCLRNPLAPGRSKDRAILVSSVMFFSFSSAMVIDSVHLRRDFSKEGHSGKTYNSRGKKAGLLLRSPPLCLGKILRFRQDRLPLRACNFVQDFIHRFLDSSVRFVELTGSF